MSVAYAYSPILKGKSNDLRALSRLSNKALGIVKPLIEILPVPPDITMDAHLEKFTNNIVKYGKGTESFVDFYGLLPGDVTSNGINATIAGFRLLRKKGCAVTPTYGFERDDSTWPLLSKEIKKVGKGFCFRIDIDDLDDKAEATWQELIERSAQLEIVNSEIDLVLDLRDVGNKSTNELKDLIFDFISYMPFGSQYRSIIIAGGSAPKTVVKIPKDGQAALTRTELRLWVELQAEIDSNIFTFGDYGVIHPDFSDIGPNPNANAKIRYTVGGKIVIYRGHKLFKPTDFKQYHALAERVRNGPDYKGAGFSVGDSYIDDCADLIAGPGNMGTWVFNDMNHHMEYTAAQIIKLLPQVNANLSGDEIIELIETV